MSGKSERGKAETAEQKLAARSGKDDEHEAAPAGYVYVTRAEPTVEVDGETKPAGYVHIPGEDERRLVDEKSLPELEVLGYRVVS